MKELNEILKDVAVISRTGNVNLKITGIEFDSRKVKAGNLFVAVRGTQSDGHVYISQAIINGAAAIVFDSDIESNNQVPFFRVKDSSVALGEIASTFYDHPSSKLKIVAITGTNGKTTVATLLFKLIRAMGQKSGLISTVENRINDRIISATHTTPDAVSLNTLLNEMVLAGCSYCFMEASSHAIHQNRMAGIDLAGAVFTNISHDHLDYHGTFDDYIAAKKKLFDELPSNAFALVNADDKHHEIMLQNCKAKKYFFALAAPATYRARVLENSFSGLVLNLDEKEFHSALIGNFNASNLVAIYSAARLLGLNRDETLIALSGLAPAEGRFDYLISARKKIVGIVDYAHTPDALDKVLSTLNKIRTGNESLITVVGCGGNRDKTKRPVMARVAAEQSDRVVLTSDNPRTENPADILEQMKSGLDPVLTKKILTVPDRREAIQLACSISNEQDIILLAGKGHEKYQEINGVKYPFDDKQVLIESFQKFDS